MRVKRLSDYEDGPQLAFSPSGRALAVAKYGIIVFNTGDPRHPAYRLSSNGEVTSIVFASEQRIIAAEGEDGRDVVEWEIAKGKPKKTWVAGVNDDISNIAISSNGTLLVVKHDSGLTAIDLTRPKRAHRAVAGRA